MFIHVQAAPLEIVLQYVQCFECSNTIEIHYGLINFYLGLPHIYLSGRVGRTRSHDDYYYLTFQGQKVWRLAKRTTLWTKSRWVQQAYVIFNKVEDVWHLKWPSVIHLVSDWQLTSLACEVSHNNLFDYPDRWLQLSQEHYAPVVSQYIEQSLQLASTTLALGISSECTNCHYIVTSCPPSSALVAKGKACCLLNTY